MLLSRVEITNFCGISSLTADFGWFSTLVGPNNGGKTTLLRAIEFALEAFRLYFGDGDEPVFSRLGESWHHPLSVVAQRLGVQDSLSFFFERNRTRPAEVLLTFTAPKEEIDLSVRCLHTDQVFLRLTRNGLHIANEGEVNMDFVRRLYAVQALFIPPLGTLSPSEIVLTFPQWQRDLALGKHAETWRNQLQWLYDGKSAEALLNVEKVVQDYLGEVKVHPPKRTRQDEPSKVIVAYSEGGVEYDISATGGGLRTLLALATAMELSPASIFLFDEPDAHLHSTVQRQVARFLSERAGEGRQVIASTHAPDFIDEVPLESLRWVERGKARAEPCDDVGKTLVRLGAVSNSQAMRTLGSNVVLFFEGTPDRQTLTALMRRCGKADLADRIKPALLKGFGDTSHLPGALRILQTLVPMKVAVAAILDADYTQTHPALTVEDHGDAIVFRLPCKELENLLLLSPETLFEAARRAADARAVYTGGPPVAPSLQEVEGKIDELTGASDLRELLHPQWLFRWATSQGHIRDAGIIAEGIRAFQQHWSSLEWRRRCCPGKEVLARLRQWLQDEPYKLSLTLPKLFEAYTPDREVQDLFDQLEAYVKRATI